MLPTEAITRKYRQEIIFQWNPTQGNILPPNLLLKNILPPKFLPEYIFFTGRNFWREIASWTNLWAENSALNRRPKEEGPFFVIWYCQNCHNFGDPEWNRGIQSYFFQIKELRRRNAIPWSRQHFASLRTGLGVVVKFIVVTWTITEPVVSPTSLVVVKRSKSHVATTPPPRADH